MQGIKIILIYVGIPCFILGAVLSFFLISSFKVGFTPLYKVQDVSTGYCPSDKECTEAFINNEKLRTDLKKCEGRPVYKQAIYQNYTRPIDNISGRLNIKNKTNLIKYVEQQGGVIKIYINTDKTVKITNNEVNEE